MDTHKHTQVVDTHKHTQTRTNHGHTQTHHEHAQTDTNRGHTHEHTANTHKYRQKTARRHEKSLTHLTLLELQSRFGDKPLEFQAVSSQNGTAVLKGLRDTHGPTKRHTSYGRTHLQSHTAGRTPVCSATKTKDARQIPRIQPPDSVHTHEQAINKHRIISTPTACKPKAQSPRSDSQLTHISNHVIKEHQEQTLGS